MSYSFHALVGIADDGDRLNGSSQAAVVACGVVFDGFYRFGLLVIDRHERQAGFGDLVGVSSRRRGVTSDLVPGVGEVGDRRTAGDETVGPGAGALQRGFRAATRPQGRVR